jgi:hypothetical protein
MFERVESRPQTWPREILRLPDTPKQCTYSGAHFTVGVPGGGKRFHTVVKVCSGDRCSQLSHLVYLSPGGFSWGYTGYAPSDLARSILADYAGVAVADTFYQDFEQQVISALPETWVLDSETIYRWLVGRLTSKEVSP